MTAERAGVVDNRPTRPHAKAVVRGRDRRGYDEPNREPPARGRSHNVKYSADAHKEELLTNKGEMASIEETAQSAASPVGTRSSTCADEIASASYPFVIVSARTTPIWRRLSNRSGSTRQTQPCNPIQVAGPTS